MPDNPHDELIVAIERLADETHQQEADYRTILERLRGQNPPDDAEAKPPEAKPPEPTADEAFLAELKQRSAGQWTSSGLGE